MKWLNKLERKFGRYYIPNLMLYIVAGNIILFLFNYLFRELNLVGYVYFDRGAILAGQVWRVLTFVFVPFDASPIWMIIAAYFYWLVGSSLEKAWGGFRFNVFYFCGVLGTIIAGFITGSTDNYYLNMSLFLAFAMVFPNERFMLFFVIPIKAKYLAYVDAAFLLISFVLSGWSGKAAIIAAFVNILIFFGGDFISGIRSRLKYRKARRNFKMQMKHRDDE